MPDASRRLPPLNGLRAFEVAARHLNFRIAAEELGVTQGAVAQQVRGLEAELGLRLFERQPRRLALTEAGRSYAASVKRAFDLIAEATDTLRPEPLHLTISVTPTFASKWLSPRLPDFAAANPDVDLSILATERISNFQTDAVDVAVRYGRPPFGTGLLADLLFEQELVAVGSPLLVERLGASMDDVRQFPLLHDAHNFWPQFIDQALGTLPGRPARNIRFNQTSLAIEAAVAGQGLALVTRFFVEDDIKAGRLVQPFERSMNVGSGFYVVSPKRARNGEAVARVRDWMLLISRSSGADRFPHRAA
jgi:LysR family transcriptional regulator, glycine cleavage system transcriptional activator